MDCAKNPFDRLPSTLGDGELLVFRAVGHFPDRFGLTLGPENRRLAVAFCFQNHRPLAAFRLEDHRAPVPLGLHLAVHGLGHVLRGCDPKLPGFSRYFFRTLDPPAVSSMM